MGKQADISVLKHQFVSVPDAIDQFDTIDISGVTDGITELGTINAEFFSHDYVISQKLHIVPDSLNIGVDGIVVA